MSQRYKEIQIHKTKCGDTFSPYTMDQYKLFTQLRQEAGLNRVTEQNYDSFLAVASKYDLTVCVIGE